MFLGFSFDKSSISDSDEDLSNGNSGFEGLADEFLSIVSEGIDSM